MDFVLLPWKRWQCSPNQLENLPFAITFDMDRPRLIDTEPFATCLLSPRERASLLYRQGVRGLIWTAIPDPKMLTDKYDDLGKGEAEE